MEVAPRGVSKNRPQYNEKKKIIETFKLRCEVVLGGTSPKVDELISAIEDSRHVSSTVIQLFSDLIWEAR